ncbi:MAG: hypothetical protein P4L92_22190 [Rudaea sp.]|nr:hypothetical protein [Rudaea sp.]
MFARLEHHEHRAFSKHQARSFCGKWPTTGADIDGIRLGQCSKPTPQAHERWNKRCFRSPGNGDIEVTVTDCPICIPDGSAGRRARAAVGQDRAQNLMANRDLCRRSIQHRRHDRIRLRHHPMLDMELLNPVMFGFHATGNRSVEQACALPVVRELLQSGIAYRLTCGQNGNLTAAIQVWQFQLREVACEILVDQTCRQALGEVRRFPQADTRSIGLQARQQFGHTQADGRDDTQPRDHDIVSILHG